ncbi:MAG: hypothetical protein QXP39_03070 [Candidatus Aenigmatarchaeota archaeon]
MAIRRTEKNFFGDIEDNLYDRYGNKIGRIEKERDIFGEKEIVYDRDGKKIGRIEKKMGILGEEEIFYNNQNKKIDEVKYDKSCDFDDLDSDLVDIFSKYLLFFVAGILLLGGCEKCCDFLSNLPKSARIEKIENRQKWEKWEYFTKNYDKWLLNSETVSQTNQIPEMPNEKLAFLSESEKELYAIDLQTDKQTKLLTSSGNIKDYIISSDEIVFIDTVRDKEIIYKRKNNKLTKIAVCKKDCYKDISWFNNSILTTMNHDLILWNVAPTIPRKGLQLNNSIKYYAFSTSILLTNPYDQSLVYLQMPSFYERKRSMLEYDKNMAETNFHKSENPVVSPDGKKLVYIHNTYSIIGMSHFLTDSKIVIRNLENYEERFISGMYVDLGSQAWSPDSKKIVFSLQAHSPNIRLGVSTNNLGIIETDERWWEKKRYNVTTNIHWLRARGTNAAWSPDGRWIAFDYKGIVYIFDISDSEIHLTQSNKIIDGNVMKVVKGKKPLWIKNK